MIIIQSSSNGDALIVILILATIFGIPAWIMYRFFKPWFDAIVGLGKYAQKSVNSFNEGNYLRAFGHGIVFLILVGIALFLILVGYAVYLAITGQSPS